MEQQQSALGLPLITEATNDFYRQVYANNDLGHIFKGVNMVVLRRHVSYFILQLTAFDQPMTEPQIDFLRKVHGPVIEERGATQRHFDILVSLLISSLCHSGAQGTALLMVQSKLRPLRDIFPSHASVCGSQAGSSLNSVDGTIVLQEGSSREQHAHHSKHKQQRCPGQCQQPRTAPGAASPLQQEEVAAQQQEQQQRVPCAGQQQHCCQHDKQASPKQQQLQATSAASAPVAIRATQQQQQQYPAPEQQLQQSPACCVMAKQQVAPEDKQQQHQAPAVSTTPVQSKLDAEQQQLKLQQQQQGKEDSLPEAVPPQPWWKCLVFCS